MLADNSRSLGSLKLCEYMHKGKKSTFACQDVVSNKRIYRVLFRGGRIPVTILEAEIHDDPEVISWSEKTVDKKRKCLIPNPARIPASAKFLGAGICENGDGQSVPCSVYRNRISRRQKTSDYMVFYDVSGKGPISASVISFIPNQDAVPAELAYQIGIELIKSVCCKQRGFAYLRYAYTLFPESAIYRTAYFRGIKKIIAEKKDHVASFQSE